MQLRDDRLRSALRMVVLVLVAVVLPLWQAAANDDPATPTVQVGDIRLDSRQSGQVEITVRNIPPTGLSGYSLTVSFDRNMVKVVSASSGDAPFDGPPIANIDNDKGVVLLAAVVASGPTSGSLVGARLAVTAVGRGGGGSQLTLNINELIDNNLNEITPRDMFVGQVTITGQPPRSWTWALWLLVPLLLAAAAWALGRKPAKGKDQ